MWKLFIKSLTKPRGITQLCFSATGALGLVYILFFCPQAWIKANERQEVVIRGMASSLLLVGGLDLLASFLQAASENPKRERFRLFFGKGIQHGVIAVFPSAKLNPNVQDPSLQPLIFENAPDVAKRLKTKGNEYLIILEHLHASLELADTFRQFEEDFRTDIDENYKDIRLKNPKNCLIAIGLGFNGLTSKIKEFHRRTNLFDIRYTDGMDDFTIGGASHMPTSATKNYALLVRGSSMNGTANIPHFVCAGLTVAGTKAAGTFLAKEWEQLFFLYKNHGMNLATDSLAILLEYEIGNEDSVRISSDIDNQGGTLKSYFFVSSKSLLWGCTNPS